MSGARRSSVIAAAALAAHVIGLTAQEARDRAGTPAGTAVVSGTVRMAGQDRAPARRVRVTLNETSGRVPGMTTSTDDAGAFSFAGVPGGRYDVQAFRAGFLRSSYGASRPDRTGTPVVVREGETVSTVDLTLVKGGVITGRVRDPDGRPLAGVTMRVMRIGFSAATGEPTLAVPTGSVVAATDDLGDYRAFGLPPGGYIVVAMPGPAPGSRGFSESMRQVTDAEVQRALASARSGAAPPPAAGALGRQVGYAPIFHPDVTDIGRAATVAIGASEQRGGVDLTLPLVPTARVSGRVSSPTGEVPPGMQVVVVPAGPKAGLLASAGIRTPRAFAGPDGSFTVGGVPAGAHRLKVSGGRPVGGAAPLSAVADILVAPGADMEVSVTLTPGLTIAGQVDFVGDRPTPAELETLTFGLLPVGGGGTALYTGGGRGAGPASIGGRVNAEGRFTFTNIPPDQYYLQWTWTSPGATTRWAATRIVANARDAFESPLRVAPGEPLALAVTFTSTPTALTGVFQDRGGRAATDYYVLVFPANRGDWVPGSRRLRMTRPATDGAFDIRGLPPGEYLLGALTDLEPGEWHDPTMLEQLSAFAVRVTLREGATTTQDIRIGG